MTGPSSGDRGVSAPFEVEIGVHGGRAQRVRVAAAPDASVGALLAAVQVVAPGSVTVDGVAVERSDRLVEVGLVHGSLVEVDAPGSVDVPAGPWALAVVGGARGGLCLRASGSSGVAFAVGESVLTIGGGRPVVHGRDGSARVVGSPDDDPDRSSGPIVRFDDGTTVRIVPAAVRPEPGARPGPVGSGGEGPWFTSFRPAPRVPVQRRPATPVRPPTDDAARTGRRGLDPAGLVGLVASLGLGMVTLSVLGAGRPVLRAAVAVLVAGPVVLRLGIELRAARVRRRDQGEAAAAWSARWRLHATDVRRWARVRAPDPVVVEAMARGAAPGRWVRRVGDEDVDEVAVGEVRATTPAESAEIWEPVLVRVGVLGVVGPPVATAAVARWAVAQLVVHGPPSAIPVDLAGVEGDADWSWAAWLPHAEAAGRASDSSAVVSLGAVGSTTRRAVVTARSWDDLPPHCTVVLDLAGGPGRASCTDLVTGTRLDGVRICGLDVEAARRVARALAPLRECGDAAGPPASVSLSDVLGFDPADEASVRAAWRSARPASCAVGLGRTATSVLSLDLVRDGPHALLVGTTGSGKSELLRSWILALAASVPPSLLTFVLADYKGGATFDGLEALPHVVATYDDLRGGADRLARGLRAELRRRERLLRVAGAESITSDAARSLGLPRLVVVVDEFTALAAERRGDLDELADVARAGRSLGLHLVLATQSVDAALSPRLRANIAVRIDLRSSTVDGVEHERSPRAERTTWPAGRALVRTGAAPSVVAQVARVVRRPSPPGRGQVRRVDPVVGEGGAAAEVARVVDAIRAAADGAVAAVGACTPPLPDRLDRRTLVTSTALHRNGRQEESPPIWLEDRLDDGVQVGGGPDLHGGGVVIVGPPGSGVETCVRVVVGATARTQGDGRVHAYLLGDVDPGSRLAPRGVEILRPGDDERVLALLRRVRDPSAGVGPRSGHADRIVVGVEDLAASSASSGHLVAELCEAALAGHPRGVRLVVGSTASRAVRGPLLGAATERILLGGVDPSDLLLSGPPLPYGPPGRAFRVRTGCWVQFVEPDDDGAAEPAGASPPPLPVLPEVVGCAALGAAVRRAGGGVVLPLGVGGDPLGPLTVAAGPGDVVLVVVRTSVTATSLTAALRSVIAGDGVSIIDLVTVDGPGDDAADAVTRAMDAGRPVVVVVALDRLVSPFGHWVTRLPAAVVAVEETVAERAAEAFGWRGLRPGPLAPRAGVARLVDGSSDPVRFCLPLGSLPSTGRSQAA